jgi:kinesin family protein 6/9
MGRKDVIKVFLRVRPHRSADGAVGTYDIQNDFEESRIAFHVDRRLEEDVVNHTREDYNFRFARVFDQQTTQEQVFDVVAKDCVLSVLDGYNSTVFAYGQTGSGKTFSITGGTESFNDRGIIPRAISLLYSEIGKRSSDYSWTVSVSYMQIYNDKGQDLLNRGEDARTLEDLPVVSVHETDDEIVLKGLEAHPSASVHEALNLLFLGDTNRLYCETSMNKTSSRSHCIFTVMLEGRQHGTAVVRRSKLNIVDLAGSERVAKTGATGTILTEAKHINLSLHYLQNVIASLEEGRDHVPYRNAMMTMVLKDSLGGNCRTAMLATGHPGDKHLLETVSTCRFAARVANIKQVATLNEEQDPAVIIRNLKKEVAALKDQVAYLTQGKETDPNRKLSADEMERCREAVARFLADPADDGSVVGVGGDMARTAACFSILKQMAKGGGGGGPRGATPSTPNTAMSASASGLPPTADAAALQDQLKRLQTSVQQKENEMSLLFGMVQKHSAPKSHCGTQTGADAVSALAGGPRDVLPAGASASSLINRSVMSSLRAAGAPADGGGGGPVPTHAQVMQAAEADKLSEHYQLEMLSDPELLKDRTVAFDAFRKSYRRYEQIERSRGELQERFTQAKALAVELNGGMDRMNALKMQIKQLRVEASQRNDPNDPATVAEQQPLMAELDRHKAGYKQTTAKLTHEKERIEHVQLIMKRSQEQLIKDFEGWFALRQTQVAGALGRPPAGAAPVPAAAAAQPRRLDSGAAFTQQQHQQQQQQLSVHHQRMELELNPGAATANADVNADLARMHKARDEMRARLLAQQQQQQQQ